MNLPSAAVDRVKELVVLLCAQDYAQIESLGLLGRLSVPELASVIAQYGRALTSPPHDFLSWADAYPLADGSGWSLDVPLWAEKEGVSDLTVSLDVKIQANGFSLEITDLRVL